MCMVGRSTCATMRSAKCPAGYNTYIIDGIARNIKSCTYAGTRVVDLGNRKTVRFDEDFIGINVEVLNESAVLKPTGKRSRTADDTRPPARFSGPQHLLLATAMALRNAKELVMKA